MLVFGVALIVAGSLSAGEAEAGGHPYTVPTSGQVWPQPQMSMSETTIVTINANQFSFNTTYQTCPLLERALDRYLAIMFPKRKVATPSKHSRSKDDSKEISVFEIRLLSPCEAAPYLHMDEQYEIKIDSPDEPGVGSVTASSVWGVLRGLESLSQLLIADGAGGYFVYATQIMDFPRFPHRGFMIDTARHFLPMDKIKEMLDLMSMNKYNVLHWHIVDDQSFPYVSAVYPNMSTQGAWSSERVYTATDIADIIAYATDRGIRVIPEFDTPGHTQSWGDGQPGLLTECYSNGTPDGTFGPIDPSKNATFDFLTRLFTEIGGRFPDPYLHLGGDEVSFDCWKSSPAITEFMTQNKITTYEELESYYITRLLDIVSKLPTANGYMVWQEVFDNHVDLAADTVVHIWKGSGKNLQEELANVTAAGFPTLLSSCWYLNRISYGIDWYPYYECDPHNFTGTAEQKSLVVGGEACMWGEWVDRTNLISRTWPRASVVAERLWSDASVNSTDAATPRLEEHRCRLLARGYDVEPLGWSYCDADL